MAKWLLEHISELTTASAPPTRIPKPNADPVMRRA